MENIASYADDNTPYTTGNSIEEVIQKLENAAKTLFQWFSDNQMKANPDKCHFLCNSNSEVSLTIETQKIKNSKFEKLLGIKLDSKLNFNSHIHDICQKAGQKLNAISRITPYMDFAKRRLIVNAFFYSQVNYCELVWICIIELIAIRRIVLREKCVRLIYNDKKLSLEDLLEKGGYVSKHNKKFGTLNIELFKILKDLSSVTLAEDFSVRQQSQCNMRITHISLCLVPCF